MIPSSIESQVAAALVDAGIEAYDEHPGYVRVLMVYGPDFAFGTVNGKWEGNRGDSAGQVEDLYLPETETRATVIAHAILRAVAPHGRPCRFVLTVGSITEALGLKDVPEGVCVWDLQEKCPVVTVHPAYANAICMEQNDSAPFTALVQWFNQLANDALASEGLPITRLPL